MNISTLDDTAHRAASVARPVAEAVAEAVTGAADAVTGAASNALGGVSDALGRTHVPHVTHRASTSTKVVRIVRQHPYAVAAGVTLLVVGCYAARRRQASTGATPDTVHLADVKAAA